MTKSNRLFQQSRGCNSKINDLIWLGIERIREFIYVQVLEDPIKTEQVMLMTKSNKGFFSNQGFVTKNTELIWTGF